MKSKILAFMILISTSGIALTQTISGEDNAYIDSLLDSFYKESGPGISLIITKDGKTVMTRSIGKADLKIDKPLKPNSIMPIGSMSKQFTAAAIMKLAEQGKLNLQDDITSFLPAYNSHGKKITIENLLTHTSGIPSYTELKEFGELFSKDVSESDIINFISKEELMFEPATNWSYSNSGYYLLAMVIQKVTGMSYAEFLRKEIFAPLGMKNTLTGMEIEKISPEMATGYEPSDESGGMKESSKIYWSWPLGAGDVISTVEDLAVWNASLLEGKLLNDDMLKAAWSPHVLSSGENTNYGYGWAISDIEGRKFINHGGAIMGFLSQAIYIPESKIYIATITNNMSRTPAEFADRIALKLSGLDPYDPPAVSVTQEQMKRYTGVYDVKRSGGRVVSNFGNSKIFRNITFEDGNLFVQTSGRPKSKLIPVDDNVFYSENTKTRFIFNLDESGAARSVTIKSFPFQLGPEELSVNTDIPLPESKKQIAISENMVSDYLGIYELMPGFNLEFSFKDGAFKVLPTGQKEQELFAETESKFFIKAVDASFEFKRGEDGKVNSVTLTQGQVYECRKIK